MKTLIGGAFASFCSRLPLQSARAAVSAMQTARQIKMLAGARTRVNFLCRMTAFLASAVLTPCWAAEPPNCSALAAQISTNPDVVAATSVLVPASGADLAYCNVQLQYSHLAGPAAGYAPSQSQLIQIGIGLPLSAADGGSGQHEKRQPEFHSSSPDAGVLDSFEARPSEARTLG